MLAQTISNDPKTRRREIQHILNIHRAKVLLYFLDNLDYLFAVGNRNHVVINLYSIKWLCVFRKGTWLSDVEELV